jgi:hypothetical protein
MMKMLAWAVLIYSSLCMVVAPALQGETVIRTPVYTTLVFIDFLACLALCGRVLGWW